MTTTTLIFTGSRNVALLSVLLGGIALVLIGWGVVQLVRRRRRYGLLCLAGGLGAPVAAIALAVDAVVGFRAGDWGRGKLSALAAGLLALAGAAAAVAIGWLDGDPVAALLLVGLAAEIALAVGLFYAIVYARLGPRRISTLMILRCAAIAAVLTVLFRPAVRRRTTPSETQAKPLLAVILDRSGSMGRKDVPGPAGAGGSERTRHAWAVDQLRVATDAIERRFAPAWYHVAEEAAPADTLDALTTVTPDAPDADDTRLAEALRTVAREHADDALAGVMLLSDGIERPGVDATAGLFEAGRRLGVPLYAAGVGTKRPAPPRGRAVRIAGAVVEPRIVAQDHVAAVKVRLALTGLAGAAVEVRLFVGDDAAPADSQFVRIARDREETDVELKWTAQPADDDGVTLADIRALRIETRMAVSSDAGRDAAEIHALVVRPRIRVLQIAGAMRPECKFLKRTLMTDPNVRLTSLIRVADNRFWAMPRTADLAGLPRTAGDFERFDVLILGNVDRTFFNDDQLARIRAFVNDGGGLLMIGGQASFGRGGYGGTDLERALPVLCGPRNQSKETSRFVPALTPLGREHPIFDGITGYFIPPDGDAPPGDVRLPELRGCVPVAGAKDGADVLAVHPTHRGADGRPLVILAVQPYGVGRSAAFTADTTWLWHLRLRAYAAEGPHARFWGQLVRWLAAAEAKRHQAGVAALAALEPSRTVFRTGEPVRIHAFCQSSENAPRVSDVRCVVVATGAPPDAPPAAAPPMGIADDPSHHRGRFTAPPPGAYRVRVIARGPDGSKLAADELPLRVPAATDGDADAETRPEHLAARHELLGRLAAQTHGPDGRRGRAVRLHGGPTGREDRLSEFVESIAIPAALRPGGAALTVTIPGAYGGPALAVLFVAFVALMTGEWLLRRRWQLQ
ncbi:MAG: hypothetical protein KGY99_04580 [Phycisphaerae bacterium]|nr:hypothetical protein [Phycisphaerae bacterium]